MKTQTTFEEFKKDYMSNFSGYVPTYFCADEKYSSIGTIKIKVEMICPYRMTDGPSRFFRVIEIVVNKEQYQELKEYAKKAGESWVSHLKEKIENCLEYSNQFKELEDIED